MNIDDIYKFCLDLIKKNQAGSLKASSFQYQWNDAQSAYQDDLLGRFQLRSNGKTGLNTGLIEDETILQKLAPFITSDEALTIASGKAAKPANFVYRLGLRINGYDCFKILQNQIASVNSNVIDPPSAVANSYYFYEDKNGFSFLPSSIATAKLDYIVSPTDVVWGYTIVNGRQVYNSATSVQSLWDSNSNREITKRMLTNLGVSYKDADMENFGKSVQLTGE